jgi:aspartyl-tRNA(Asn)/glutamyl-tRNA(Gln) amidotransferase subunit A
VRNAESVSARDYLARLARLRALARGAAPRLDAIDVMSSPTLCLTPPLMSEAADPEGHLRVNRRIVRNTVAVNYLGLCAITLPVGCDRAGMPVGVQLIAPAGRVPIWYGGARRSDVSPLRAIRRRFYAACLSAG